MGDTFHKPWDTYRSICGRARVTFHPDWSESLPWVTYMDGTAGRHFASLNSAVVHLTDQFKVKFTVRLNQSKG